jgi:hypothetical protein
VIRRNPGLMSVPSFPLNLNTATDEILKADFDALRNVQESDYWLFAKYNLNVVPFQHEDVTKWRDGFEVSTKFILLYVDGDRGAKSFFPEPATELGRLDFRTSLMIINGDEGWIEQTLHNMKAVLDQDEMPESNMNEPIKKYFY